MTRFILPAALFILGMTMHGPSFSEEPIHERIEWSDIWITDANKEELPRVLMVGDSIVRGYFSEVEKRLKGQAYCARYTTSKFMGDPDFLEELEIILNRFDFAVIHINNGLHGWGYTEKEYEEGFPDLLDLLKDKAKGATIIWGMTTPVRTEDLSEFAEMTKRVRERNAIAREIMERSGIEINDLFGLVESHPEYYAKDGTHFNGEGNAVLGEKVAGAIAKHLAGTLSEEGGND